MVKCVRCGEEHHISEDVWAYTFEDIDKPTREVGLCIKCFGEMFMEMVEEREPMLSLIIEKKILEWFEQISRQKIKGGE
jgi:hypothetical protein